MADEHKAEKAMAGMLKRNPDASGVWPPTSSGEVCPDAATLAAYFDRSLTEPEVAQWESHFSVCTRCQEQLAALARSEPAPVAKPSAEARPAFSWLWDWRWMAPIGAAVVLLVALVSYRTLFAPGPTDVGEGLVAKREAPNSPAAADLPQKPAEPVAGKTEAAAHAISPTKSPSTPQREASRGELTAKDVVVKMDKLQRANEAGTVESAQAAQAEKDKGGRLAEGASASVAGRAMPKQADEEKQIAAAESRVVVAQPAAPAVAGAAPSGVQAAQGISGGVQGAQKQDQVVVAAETKAATAQVTSEMPGQKQAALKKERAAVRQDTDAGRYALQTTPQSVAGYRARTDEILLTTPNSKVIWRLGSAGRIERSRDAGKTWEAQKALTQESLLSGSAPAENICWVGGSNGVLLRTTDGGENWERIPSPTKIAIVSIKATDQLTATVTTADGRTYETRDAGAHWRAR